MDDKIYRQQAIDILTRLEPSFRGSVLEQALKNMPPAQPERKKGRWIEDPSGYGFWICSACGFVSEASCADLLYNFCPHCGVDMRGKQDD